jgi:hypothetical protein
MLILQWNEHFQGITQETPRKHRAASPSPTATAENAAAVSVTAA